MSSSTETMSRRGLIRDATQRVTSSEGKELRCQQCGIQSAKASARFCWNCGGNVALTRAAVSPGTPLAINPGEPMYITSQDLNTQLLYAEEVSYIQVATERVKPTVPKLVTSEKLALHNCLPHTASFGKHRRQITDASTDVSDGASTTVSDNSCKSLEVVDTNPAQEITTLMLCALPYELSSEELLQTINELGFSGAYDFVYMPCRSTRHGAKSRKGNVGYAFVNFGTAERAKEFSAAFQGFSFEGPSIPGNDDEKVTSVKPASCQGFVANFALYLAKKKQTKGEFMTFQLLASDSD